MLSFHPVDAKAQKKIVMLHPVDAEALMINQNAEILTASPNDCCLRDLAVDLQIFILFLPLALRYSSRLSIVNNESEKKES
jgi:hypothetical protein